MDGYYRGHDLRLLRRRIPRRPTHQPTYEPATAPYYYVGSARALGLLVEGLLALCCFGLASAKWARVREEMLSGGPEAV